MHLRDLNYSTEKVQTFSGGSLETNSITPYNLPHPETERTSSKVIAFQNHLQSTTETYDFDLSTYSKLLELFDNNSSGSERLKRLIFMYFCYLVAKHFPEEGMQELIESAYEIHEFYESRANSHPEPYRGIEAISLTY